jgi:hypothetical protein
MEIQLPDGSLEDLYTEMLFGVRHDSSTIDWIPDPEYRGTFDGSIEDRGHGLKVHVVGGVLNCTKEERGMVGLDLFHLHNEATLQIPCEPGSQEFQIFANKIRLEPRSKVSID